MKYLKTTKYTQQLFEIMRRIEKGEKVAVCCLSDEHFERTKSIVIKDLQASHLDVSLADNLQKVVAGKSDGLNVCHLYDDMVGK